MTPEEQKEDEILLLFVWMYKNKKKVATFLIDEFFKLTKEMNVEMVEGKCYEQNDA